MAAELDPFVDSQDQKSFYATSTLSQRIELVAHLINFGRQMIVVAGAAGSGKTIVLDRIADLLNRHQRVVRFVAGPTLNRSALLHKLCEEFAVEAGADDDDALIAAIQVYVRAAASRQQRVALVIDDAQNLPADTFPALIELAHGENEAEELKVLMATDPAEAPIVDRLQADGHSEALLHIVEIPRLTEEQTVAMLRHRWRATHGEQELPLSTVQLSQIYRQSNGLAGKAITLARQVQIIDRHARPAAADPAAKYLLYGVGAIVLFSVFAIFNAGDPEEAETPQNVELTLPPAQVSQRREVSEIRVERNDPTNPVEPANGAGAQPDTSHSSADALTPLSPSPEPEVETTDGADPSVADTATLAESAAPGEEETLTSAPPAALIEHLPPELAYDETESSSPPVASMTTDGAASPTTEPRERSESPAETPVAEVVAPAAPAPAPKPTSTSSTTYTIDWLKRQSSDGYVLQLFGVRDRLAAVEFIRRKKIVGESAVYLTQYDDAPWYVVVFGYFPDRESARDAIAKLPPNLADTRPWTRPISSLK